MYRTADYYGKPSSGVLFNILYVVNVDGDDDDDKRKKGDREMRRTVCNKLFLWSLNVFFFYFFFS